MRKILYPKKPEWPRILARPGEDSEKLEQMVAEILGQVRARGDAALLEYTERFDRVLLTDVRVGQNETASAQLRVPSNLKAAIEKARQNILRFHLAQRRAEVRVETSPGIVCWRKAIPIESVGLYAPGGTAPLFSTVLMLGVPAQLAGCPRIVLCSPPNRQGTLDPVMLYAASLVGIREIYKAGGAQAIAAMACGTESIAKVQKILGPGNQYVTCAKQLVQKEGVAIDLPAGPSEVLIVADESCVPAFVAADLLSQAEHLSNSQVILVSTAECLVDQIIQNVQNQLLALPRQNFAAQSLAASAAIVVRSREEALELANEYAPEHLVLSVKDPRQAAEKVINAGSVFLGNYTPEALGDYASGTNHILPTNGWAKACSGVSLESFMKTITFQEATREGLLKLGPAVEIMAEAESLQAHKNAITLRREALKDD